MKAQFLLIATVIKFTFLFQTAVQAQSIAIWSCNAMASIPGNQTIQNDLYEIQSGKVFFKEGKTGTITLICPINENLGPAIRSLFITYRDGDGHEGPAEVKAALRRVSKANGDAVSFTYGEVSSNDDGNPQINIPAAPNSGPEGWATHQSARPGKTMLNQNHQMDLKNYYYYVQITMTRNGQTPLAVMGVYLVN